MILASRKGFGVVLGQSAYKTLKDGCKVKRNVTWKCECAGFPDTRRRIGGKRLPKEFEGEPVATKKSKKCGCEAGMYVGLKDHDQDPDMRKALKVVMPQTTYRRCLWHITEKFGSKLGKCLGYHEFKDELKNVIYDSLFLEEFELRWKDFIVKYKLESNLWLAVIESLKELEMKVKEKTTPALPMSSVGETGFEFTRPTVNRMALTFETPSSVGKSGIQGVIVPSGE
uniref:Protein FAR1-RELATED SEQUENCE n=1 Tax=Chenopodium quinoa TaxID=63459 RepID=A0A803N3N4_CHEQI